MGERNERRERGSRELGGERKEESIGEKREKKKFGIKERAGRREE